MKAGAINSINAAISEDRLEPYFRRVFPAGKPLTPSDEDLTICYSLYMWNTILSESLYPVLQAIEVTLRNSIHDAASNQFGDKLWFDSIIAVKDQKPLEEVKSKLTLERKPVTPGRVVAGLSFGFWVSLFWRRYDGILWPKLLSQVFPNIPRRVRTRRQILIKLDAIRKLRNRVSHHEPIWHWGALANQHQEILASIAWLNPHMLQMVTPFDRFQEVYRDGRQRCEQVVKESLGDL